MIYCISHRDTGHTVTRPRAMEEKELKVFKILILGDSGTGKTLVAATGTFRFCVVTTLSSLSGYKLKPQQKLAMARTLSKSIRKQILFGEDISQNSPCEYPILIIF